MMELSLDLLSNNYIALKETEKIRTIGNKNISF